MNILIVEDNRHMRRMLMEMVGAAYQPAPVLEAEDGWTALMLCRAARPELVLMDIGLPDISGFDLTVEIKAMLPDSDVVIVSSHRSPSALEAARVAGAAAYVFKDEVYEKLLPVLARVLEQRRGT